MSTHDQLYELQQRLDKFQIYRSSEIEAVAATRDPAEITRLLDPVVDRVREMYEPAQADLHNALAAFVQLYPSLSQGLPSRDPALENLYTFGRLLLPRLPSVPKREMFEVAEGGRREPYRSTHEAMEVDLLRSIRRELPAGVAGRYQALMKKRRAELLTEAEHAELIRLTDESEQLQAERVQSLAELARLRRTSLTKLAEDLRFPPRLNA
ncbi:MAG TPA: hypothetical protein VKM72_33505 [Thermoanaerobaculia bacterium]|nr:hypothetical protein [Thermoanaerobaculia bacterium]